MLCTLRTTRQPVQRSRQAGVTTACGSTPMMAPWSVTGTTGTAPSRTCRTSLAAARRRLLLLSCRLYVHWRIWWRSTPPVDCGTTQPTAQVASVPASKSVRAGPASSQSTRWTGTLTEPSTSSLSGRTEPLAITPAIRPVDSAPRFRSARPAGRTSAWLLDRG